MGIEVGNFRCCTCEATWKDAIPRVHTDLPRLGMELWPDCPRCGDDGPLLIETPASNVWRELALAS